MAQYDIAPIALAVLKGVLSFALGETVNYVNAPFIAQERGVKVIQSKSELTRNFASYIKVRTRTKDEELEIEGALFGATNQLLAGLAFLVITFYLWRRGTSMWFLVFPLVLMLVMPMWAMIYQIFISPGWLVAEQPKYLLGGIGLATIVLEIWMIIEAVRLFPKAKGVLEENALDQQSASAKA